MFKKKEKVESKQLEISINQKFTTEETIVNMYEEFCNHIKNGYSKHSFWLCDYDTVKSYISKYPSILDIKKLEQAERENMKFWEQLLVWAAAWKFKTNWVPVIFALKNKFPVYYKDRTDLNIDTAKWATIIFGLDKSPFVDWRKATALKKERKKENLISNNKQWKKK